MLGRGRRGIELYMIRVWALKIIAGARHESWTSVADTVHRHTEWHGLVNRAGVIGCGHPAAAL